MDKHTRELWTAHLATAGRETLRPLAIVVNTLLGGLLSAIPLISARPAGEDDLYLAVGHAVLAAALLLAVTSRRFRRTIALLGIVVPAVALLVLVGASANTGELPMLLVWPALASAYFSSRLGAAAVLALIAGGTGVAVATSPDPRLSALSWLVIVAVCGVGGVSLRLMAERGDDLVVALRERARRDPLTGLLNRRGFDEVLTELWASPSETDLAAVFFDLDRFKSLNDAHGHDAGDAALRAFADVLRSRAGDADAIARMGGEEFAVLLHERGRETALDRARAVVEAFDGLPVLHEGGTLWATVSAGVAHRTAEDATAADLCRRADRALYVAKEAGRNRAVLHG